MSREVVRLTYRIETRGEPERVAAKIASDQSTGTFVDLPGETEALKARVAARVVAVRPLPRRESPRSAARRAGRCAGPTPTSTSRSTRSERTSPP